MGNKILLSMHPRNFGSNKIVRQHVILVCPFILGTLRSNDTDGKENVKKNNRFYKQNKTLHVHHAFLHISLPVFARLQHKQATTKIFFFLFELAYDP